MSSRETIASTGRKSRLTTTVFQLLALFHPVAVDLRVVVSALRINTDLERVGDLAVNLAEAAQRYLTHPPVKPLVDLPRMGELALTMLREALAACVSRHRRCLQRGASG